LLDWIQESTSTLNEVSMDSINILQDQARLMNGPEELWMAQTKMNSREWTDDFAEELRARNIHKASLGIPKNKLVEELDIEAARNDSELEFKPQERSNKLDGDSLLEIDMQNYEWKEKGGYPMRFQNLFFCSRLVLYYFILLVLIQAFWMIF